LAFHPLWNRRRPLALRLASEEEWTGRPLSRCLYRLLPRRTGFASATSGSYVAFHMAEVAIPRDPFADVLRLIAELRPSSVTSTA